MKMEKNHPKSMFFIYIFFQTEKWMFFNIRPIQQILPYFFIVEYYFLAEKVKIKF